MGRLAVIGGHSILGNEPAGELERETVATGYGEVELLGGEGHLESGGVGGSEALLLAAMEDVDQVVLARQAVGEGSGAVG